MSIAQFSNAIITKDENGEYHFKALAASTDQTQPLNVEDEVDAGIPRDKSVGLDQTEADYLEYEQKYEKGKDNTDSKVVPRSKGDSGITGWDKTTFEDEESNNMTSGNPDTYVQSVQENVEPSKAGSKENHAANSENDLEVTGENDLPIIEQMAAKIERLEKELHKERTLRSREAIASKIVNLEVTSGLSVLSESEADNRIKQMASKTPAESLQRELERTKSIVDKLNSTGNTVSGNIRTSGVQAGSFSTFANSNVPTLQTLYTSVDNYGNKQHLPKSYISNANSQENQIDRLRQATADTALNRQFKNGAN